MKRWYRPPKVKDVECTGSADEGSTVCDDDQNSSSTLPSPERSVLHAFEGIHIPSTWSRVPCLAEGSLAYARCEMEANNFSSLFIERMVVFGAVSADDGSATATVYLRGRESFKEVLGSRCEAEEFIKDIDVVSLCEGCSAKADVGEVHNLQRHVFRRKMSHYCWCKG
ncbi:hypothetical protein HPB51_001276 [Rhipicephalus microplus]|uniref:Uncharacterized protein n=1 Tax=Rhipicephalus microplus TaxID=6941 RepID=A0A9J6E4Y8_RHIMP|nr:hypothetical protein HPB51_001276 [Rhipicephalus microplus]